jgi:cell division protein FtsQ
MRSLIFGRRRAANDPAPSRFAWRMQRLLLTPAFLMFLRAGLPILALAASVVWYFSDAGRVERLRDTVSEARAAFEARPEFAVHLMTIDGADDDLAAEIRSTLPLIFPVSSFDLDLEDLRGKVAELDPVKAATARIKPGGILHLQVEPREPVLIWRNPEGLALLDAEGVFVRRIDARRTHPNLPVVAGRGVPAHVGEAVALIRAAAPLGARVRGLERIGARRWDVVLDRGQRLLLPETGAVQALERIMTLDAAEDILSRDVVRVDMRLGARPTVQMSAFATDLWWSVQQAGQ